MNRLKYLLVVLVALGLSGCGTFNPMSLLSGTDIALDGENVKAEAGQHNDTELRLANGFGVIVPVPFGSLPTISTSAVVSVDSDSLTISTPTEVKVQIPANNAAAATSAAAQ